VTQTVLRVELQLPYLFNRDNNTSEICWEIKPKKRKTKEKEMNKEEIQKQLENKD